jgi:hypothetical protein
MAVQMAQQMITEIMNASQVGGRDYIRPDELGTSSYGGYGAGATSGQYYQQGYYQQPPPQAYGGAYGRQAR